MAARSDTAASSRHYPPAPWRLTGNAAGSVFRVAVAALPTRMTARIPAGHRLVAPGGRAVLVAGFVRYTPPGAVVYDEFVVAMLVRAGLRVRLTVGDIWVSEAAAADGGRALWALPKRRARFGFGPPATAGPQGAADAHLTGRVDVRLPGRPRVGFAVAQRLSGRDVVTANVVRGRLHLLAGAVWEIPADGPLAYLRGRRPWPNVALTQLGVVFGARVRELVPQGRPTSPEARDIASGPAPGLDSASVANHEGGSMSGTRNDRSDADEQREFIRARPEESLEQGGGAGPDSPETLEPTQGERPSREDRDDQAES